MKRADHKFSRFTLRQSSLTFSAKSELLHKTRIGNYEALKLGGKYNLMFKPQLFSLRRDCQKLPMPTIFQVVMAGYWEKFSISNNRASDNQSLPPQLFTAGGALHLRDTI